jgi:hypothetical protein
VGVDIGVEDGVGALVAVEAPHAVRINGNASATARRRDVPKSVSSGV